MAGRRLVLLLPLLPLLAGPSHADYQSDRQWRDLPGGRAAMLIRRLYLGKQHSNTCLGNLEEQCLRWQGEPTERREVSAGEEHLLYYGKKTLYRGTGASNAAVGPEWREYTLREGKVVDEFEIVQVMEFGSPWLPVKPEQVCEPYGMKGSLSCTGVVVPFGPVPEVTPSKPPFDFSCPPGAAEPKPGTRTAAPIDLHTLSDAVVTETYRLAGHEDFSLTTLAPRRAEDSVFVLGQSFMGSGGGQGDAELKKASCASSVLVNISYQANILGTIIVGVCDRTSELTWKDLCEARTDLGNVFLLMGMKPSDLDPAFQVPGIPPRHESLWGGLQLDYVGVLLVGHGFGVVQTAILTRSDARDAIVIQYEGSHFCRWAKNSRLCTDTKRILTELGVRLANRFLPKP